MTLLEAGKPPDHLFIVKQGIVEAEAPGKPGTRLLQLTSGEMFPLGALLTGRVRRIVISPQVTRFVIAWRLPISMPCSAAAGFSAIFVRVASPTCWSNRSGRCSPSMR